MKPHANPRGGIDTVIKAAIAGIDIKVIAGRGASRAQQFRHRKFGGHRDHLGGEIAPDGKQAFQPAEQLGILAAGHDTGQRLKHVVVGIDQTGQHHVTGKVDDLIGGRGQVAGLSDRDDHVVFDINTTPCDLAAGGVHRDHAIGVFQKD